MMVFLKNIVKRVLPHSLYEKIKKLFFYFRRNDILPIKVRLEACTICQLRCKACSFQNSNCPSLGRGYLKFSDFKKFIQKNKFIRKIELSNYGEIFLNPDLLKIIEYASVNNIALNAMNGVNFNSVTDEVLEALVKYRFRAIRVSIDGASQEIYSQYRINGNFDTVISNIRKLNNYKLKYHSEFPKLIWQFILMEHNENDVIMAKKMAEELKMKIDFKLTWVKGYIPKNTDMLRKETGIKYLSREEYVKNDERNSFIYKLCHSLWDEPQINWDGRLLGCCCTRSDFGINVFRVGFKKALNSKNYIYAKKLIQGKIDSPKTKKIYLVLIVVIIYT